MSRDWDVWTLAVELVNGILQVLSNEGERLGTRPINGNINPMVHK